MKEHPILFSAPMIRAILAGTKTQTRRIVKPQPEHAQIHTWKGETLYDGEARVWCWRDNVWPDASVDCNGRDDVSALLLPFARWEVGDRLWVKETWAAFTGGRTQDGEEWDEYTGKIADMRDENGLNYVGTDGLAFAADGKHSPGRWRPSIFMPRWASRITLEVTDVRVERLQAISDADARAEGLRCLSKDGGVTYKHGIPDRDGLPGTDDDGWPWHEWEVDPRAAYRKLWESINGAASWVSDPWVWVLGFRRVEA